ncbi:hypothetical protein ES707_07204 [subsurface metagenome]
MRLKAMVQSEVDVLGQSTQSRPGRPKLPVPGPQNKHLILLRVLHRIMMGLAVLLAAFLLQASYQAQAQTARIVGLGATTCRGFNEDVKSNPTIRRDYLAWTQGFMSGILLGRPPGTDEALDLAPSSFDLNQQLRFLEEYCASHDREDFADAVTALYKRLRQERKT